MAAALRLPPFPQAHQLADDDATEKTVQRSACRARLGVTRNEVLSALERELDTAAIDEWLRSAGNKHTHDIDAIHQHVFKNRKIVVVEDPTLHLGYLDDRVYLKPIPRQLFNYNFWIKSILPESAPINQTDYKLETLSRTCRTALGLLRSYSRLIQHESDFDMAQDARVLPRDISYPDFEDFISSFRFVEDEAVSQRYTYGQFHLTSETPRPWDDTGAQWGTTEYLKLYGAFAVVVFVMFCPLLSLSEDTPSLGSWPTLSEMETLGYYFIAFIAIVTLSLALPMVVGLAALALFNLFF